MSVKQFKHALRYNQPAIHEALLPHFINILISIPSLESNASALRIKFKSDPEDAIADLLDLVRVSDDLDVWKEFIKALEAVGTIKPTRRLFITDEELAAFCPDLIRSSS